MLLKIHFLERAGGTDRIQEILIHLSVRVISCIPVKRLSVSHLLTKGKKLGQIEIKMIKKR